MKYFSIAVGLFAVLAMYIKVPWILSFLAALLFYITIGGLEQIKIFIHCFPRDLKYFVAIFKIGLFTKKKIKQKFMLYDYLTQHAEKYPNKPAYVSAETGEQLTFKQANGLANKIANYFHDKGYCKGDVVALMMENRIEYIPIWLGLSKIGVGTALINTNLKEKSLQHCIEIVSPKSLIYTSLMSDAVKTIDIPSIELVAWDKEQSNSLAQKLENVSSSDFNNPVRENNALLYIYTSGTTGLPKAVIMKALKYALSGSPVTTIFSGRKNDILYNVLPLYHSNGGLVAVVYTLHLASTMIIRRKFSASNFFKDCCTYNCTVFNYIGEICRYLLAQPAQEHDAKHSLRLMIGNGLKRSIWKEFQNRFHVLDIKEFFGSTEGNLFLCNTTNKVGAVGFYPSFLKVFMPMQLVKVDEKTGEILRGPDGLGIPVKCGEPGMLIGKIDEKRSFNEYVNKKATEKKIAYDVISKGDCVFVFGDMLYTDKYDYFYFADRLGDTFRWKGENVSTNEVEGVISNLLHLNDVSVYGVEINGTEGKAGMACVVDPERTVDVDSLSSKMEATLPSYARPIFLRLSNHVRITGTFKFQKSDLRKDGFNPTKCGDDHLYFFDLKTKKYRELDSEVYEEIQGGGVRF